MISAPDILAIKNKVLTSIPLPELECLWPHLSLTRLVMGQQLHEADGVITQVYFIEHGIASVMARTGSDDQSVEVGLIGREGVTGSLAILGEAIPMFNSVVMQSAGEAYRITTRALHKCLRESPVLRRALGQNHAFLHADVSQTAACNSQHKLPHRLARWLLMAHDRASKDELPLTQDALAGILGTGRPSLTLAMQSLEVSGFVKHTRSRTAIMDRNGLEEKACPCYRRLRTYIERW